MQLLSTLIAITTLKHVKNCKYSSNDKKKKKEFLEFLHLEIPFIPWMQIT